jgi:Rps23 Pro-64 3,4-dihydroxylase Tpa1-like proline 4-hydroxylase
VSYIIYLTDPDDEWCQEDGGALELYPIDQVRVFAVVTYRGRNALTEHYSTLLCSTVLYYSYFIYILYSIMKGSMINNGEENGGNQGVPAVAPTVSILPKFNSMAVFTVQPGRSYHSVQVL